MSSVHCKKLPENESVAYFQVFSCSKRQFYHTLILFLSRGLSFQWHMDQGQVTIQTLVQMINREQEEYFEFKQAQITKAFSNLVWLTHILKHS